MASLFDPLKIGDIQLANRIVMAPLTRNRSPGAVPNTLNAAYYEQRASAGLIITEGTPITQQGQGYADVPGLYTPEALAGGALALVRDGDMVRVDAVAGTLDVLVDEAEWAARTPAPHTPASQTGFGRELFTNFRRNAGGAEQGACTWL